MRLNSNAKFIREISEEEEKEMIHNTELKLSKQEGKEEKTIDVIKNLLIKHMSIEDIADVVNLSTDEVKNIIKENNLDKTGE